MEQAATSINEYGGWVVPGLLQTRDYARAAAAGDTFGYEDVMPEQIEAAVEVRLRRQQVLERVKPPKLRVVIDEAVLARTTGGRTVMSAQLEHLEEAAARPGVSIQVIGFDQGVYHGGSRGHYVLVELDDELPAVIYQEGLGSPVDTSAKDDLDRYRRAWRAVRAKALDPFKSRELIARYRSQLVDSSGHP
jgi:hypothetical protein